MDFLRSKGAFCTLFHAQSGLPVLQKWVLYASSRTKGTSCVVRYFTHKINFLRSKSAFCTLFRAQRGLIALKSACCTLFHAQRRLPVLKSAFCALFHAHNGLPVLEKCKLLETSNAISKVPETSLSSTSHSFMHDHEPSTSSIHQQPKRPSKRQPPTHYYEPSTPGPAECAKRLNKKGLQIEASLKNHFLGQTSKIALSESNK